MILKAKVDQGTTVSQDELTAEVENMVKKVNSKLY